MVNEGPLKCEAHRFKLSEFEDSPALKYGVSPYIPEGFLVSCLHWTVSLGSWFCSFLWFWLLILKVKLLEFEVFSLLYQLTVTNLESPWLWECCSCYGFWKSIQISSWIFFLGLCAYLPPTQGREYGEQSLCLSGGQEAVTLRFDSEDFIC